MHDHVEVWIITILHYLDVNKIFYKGLLLFMVICVLCCIPVEAAGITPYGECNRLVSDQILVVIPGFVSILELNVGCLLNFL